MLELIETSDPGVEPESAWADVRRVCNRIPPLWDLPNYVAVNPFLGFTDIPLDEAAQIIGDGLNARVLPPLEFYRRRWSEGAFGPAELAEAAARRGHDTQALADILGGRGEAPRRTPRLALTFAERHDREYGTDWNDLLGRSVARWCAVHVSEGGSGWRLPRAQRGLYASWLEAARVDRSLELAGLHGWRAWIAALPERPDAAATVLLDRLPILPRQREAYLYRLLGGLYGWASYLRRSGWEQDPDEPGEVADLLAIRLCTDAAVAELARPLPTRVLPGAATVEDESVRLTLQDAIEDGFIRRLLGKLAAPSPAAAPGGRPAVQAVFCIDVRSELMRRHLEAEDPAIETLGFAGFFGVALDWRTGGECSARCPVLLKPGVRLQAPVGPDSPLSKKSIKHLQGAPGSSFTFVELFGILYGAQLANDTFTAIPPAAPVDGRDAFVLEPDGRGAGVAPAARLDLAAGILKNMGLRTRFARLVLLCGHEGASANNPHAAGLDCGACGGHGGAINARVAAALLNDPAVREGLPARGWIVPTDTHFVPAVHNTSTDELTVFDRDHIPSSHEPDLAMLEARLAQASDRVRRERAAALGLCATRPAGVLERLVRRRTRDWSEVRPEWALARNAAFIAARRIRTRGADLEGRAFLHEYDATTDPDNSILTLILSAPMVVASWINLQYFASTVDNDVFGCGTKALHNRVGDAGVVLGNGGDLRTGLARQSVHAPDGRWFHEPLRLQVVVEAPPERIEQVLADQPGVAALVEHGWVRLFALDLDGSAVLQRRPGAGWQRIMAVP